MKMYSFYYETGHALSDFRLTPRCAVCVLLGYYAA